MRFDAFFYILHNNSIVDLLGTSWDYLRSPPKFIEKK